MREFKFIASSDIHIKNKRPEKRIDNFVRSQRRKIAWLFKTAQEKDAYLLCGGDFFDTPTVAYKLVREYIVLAQKYNVKILSVFGQHDLRYHAYSSHENTPLSVLLAGLGTTHIDESPFENELVCVQGASWEKEYPYPKQGKVNILLTHRLVTEGQGLWPGHIGFFKANEMIENTGFDIIVSGDNHQSFVMEKDGKFLFNSGSLMRLSSDQYAYKPKVPLVTVKIDGSIEYEWLEVPIKKSSLVFSKDSKVEIQENDETIKKIKEFISSLNKYKIDRPDFLNKLHIVSKKVDANTSNMLKRIVTNVAQNDSKVSLTDISNFITIDKVE